ncbi:uracil-DNA glycosylase [Bacillus sp. FJAT-29937]|uniref:uracil-DNA glycosylase n=1 Tax=Bacillus sp. FJAT-29937 TaxID=1720553 RepID=UPI0009EA5E66|nr:uracil-DNA glycosylase [Bacillus sp. FJAT-29937]
MNKNLFARLLEITHTLIPYEINLMTHYNGWEDSIDLRGKNLMISIIDEQSEYDYKIKLSDERGVTVTVPCEGVEYINEYRNNDQLIIEIYLYIFEGVARITVKGKEVIIQNTNKEIEYNMLINKAKACVTCKTMSDSKAIIGYANGNLDADILFLAEAPGPRGADVSGIPLQGDVTGKNFEKLLSSTNWTRSDIFITNAVLCCPVNSSGKVRPPSKEEIKNCHPYLKQIIELVDPKIVVTLGKKALEALKEIEHHSLVLNQNVATYTKWNGRYVYPLYHPSPQVINTGKRTLQQQRTDFKQLEHNDKQRILKGKAPINFQNKDAE